MVKNPSASADDVREAGSIPGSGRSPVEGNGNPLQYFHLENPMDRGALLGMVHRVTESNTTEACRSTKAEGIYSQQTFPTRNAERSPPG